MEIELFTDPDEDVIEFRGVNKRLFLGDLIVFQIVVPATTFEESPEGVFKGNNITVAVGKDFFKIEEGKREFRAPITTVKNSEELRKALRGQVTQNPVEEQQVDEDEPRNYGGSRRVQTFRTSSKRVSKNGHRLTRKSRHGRRQHGQH